MSDENASDRLDQRLDAFEQDTGIWPPGRDQAPEMAVGESKEDMRWRAWEYWQKATRQLAAKDAEIARLREALEDDDELMRIARQQTWPAGVDATGIRRHALTGYRAAILAAAEK